MLRRVVPRKPGLTGALQVLYAAISRAEAHRAQGIDENALAQPLHARSARGRTPGRTPAKRTGTPGLNSSLTLRRSKRAATPGAGAPGSARGSARARSRRATPGRGTPGRRGSSALLRQRQDPRWLRRQEEKARLQKEWIKADALVRLPLPHAREIAPCARKCTVANRRLPHALARTLTHHTPSCPARELGRIGLGAGEGNNCSSADC